MADEAPPAPAPRFPDLTLGQARAASAVWLLGALLGGVYHLARLYACAPGAGTSRTMVTVWFGVAGLAARRVGPFDRLVVADAHRLRLPERARLAEALRASMEADRARAAAGGPALTRQHWTAAALVVAAVAAFAVTDHMVKSRPCAGRVAQDLVIVWGTVAVAVVTVGLYLRSAARDVRQYRAALGP